MTVYNWSSMSPRERDALVSEKVFGYKIITDYWGQPKYVVHQATFDIPVYTTDTSAAWEVVEHFDGHAISKYSSNGGRRAILYNNDGTRGEALGQIGQPLAEIVCLAALRAVGVDIQ